MPANGNNTLAIVAMVLAVLALGLHITGFLAPTPPVVSPGPVTAIQTNQGPITGDALLQWMQDREASEVAVEQYLLNLQTQLVAGPCPQCGPPIIPPKCSILGNC